MLVHAPGWSLAIASIEVIPPKLSFFAPKNDIFNKGCAPTFEKISHTKYFPSFLVVFVGKFCQADFDSGEQQAVRLKKVENFSMPKLRFFSFSGETFGTICHAVLDFREH